MVADVDGTDIINELTWVYLQRSPYLKAPHPYLTLISSWLRHIHRVAEVSVHKVVPRNPTITTLCIYARQPRQTIGHSVEACFMWTSNSKWSMS